MEVFGVMLGTSLVVLAIAAALVAVLFPLFWLWMLVDALLREPADYPGGDGTEKLVWVLLVLVAHWGAIVYYFAVYANRGRTAIAVPALAA